MIFNIKKYFSNNKIFYIYIEISGNASIISFHNKLLASLYFYNIKENLLSFYPTFDIECGDKILFLHESIGSLLELTNLKPSQIIDKICD